MTTTIAPLTLTPNTKLSIGTIESFYVYSNMRGCTVLNITTMEEAVSIYRSLIINDLTKNDYIALGVNLTSPNELPKAIDLFYNEIVKVNDVILYNHTVISNRVHSVKNELNQFKNELLNYL